MSSENEPLLGSNPPESQYTDNSYMEPIAVDPEQVANITDATPETGPSVTCRVCEHEILLENRMMNHVVRCDACNEATPIRAAPPGKKYVRCPCNCLLICKASSSRIACPRENCRRVITLGPTGPVDTPIRAPAGTCRVQCVECQEIFMFNTLNNAAAHCPHCRTVSSVGTRYKRARALIFFLCLVLSASVGFLLTMYFKKNHYWLLIVLVIAAYGTAAFFIYKFFYYLRMKVSQILGPV
uniref:Phosphatidylinositol-4,5-bisphosphate 4-phosphatase n=1 Tax=Panagrellus redivivus TaxID=6233 RepID=A0A7E4V2H8_PANRE